MEMILEADRLKKLHSGERVYESKFERFWWFKRYLPKETFTDCRFYELYRWLLEHDDDFVLKVIEDRKFGRRKVLVTTECLKFKEEYLKWEKDWNKMWVDAGWGEPRSWAYVMRLKIPNQDWRKDALW